MQTSSRQVRRLTGALVVALVAAMTTWLGASPASAGWSPPAPIAKDRYGTKYDEYMLPEMDDAYWSLDGVSKSKSFWYSTNGRAAFNFVATNYMLGTQVSVPITFGTEDNATAVQAKDSLRVVVGECLPDKSRRVTAYVTNTADYTGWPMGEGYVYAVRQDGISTGSYPVVTGVEDGEERAFEMDATAHMGVFGNNQLPRWTFTLYAGLDNGVVVARVRAQVLDCRKSSTDNGNQPPTSHTGKPRVSVKRFGRGVKVRLDNRSRRAVQFRSVLKPCRGSAKRRSVRVSAGRVKVVTQRRFTGQVVVRYRSGGKAYKVAKRVGRC